MALNSILSTTLQLLRDKLVDNSFIAHPLLRAIEENGGLIKVSGGSRVECPVIFGEHSSITSLVSGFEAVNMAVTDPLPVGQVRVLELHAADCLEPGREGRQQGRSRRCEHP